MSFRIKEKGSPYAPGQRLLLFREGLNSRVVYYSRACCNLDCFVLSDGGELSADYANLSVQNGLDRILETV